MLKYVMLKTIHIVYLVFCPYLISASKAFIQDKGRSCFLQLSMKRHTEEIYSGSAK